MKAPPAEIIITALPTTAAPSLSFPISFAALARGEL
jgi:hypothetical protein